MNNYIEKLGGMDKFLNRQYYFNSNSKLLTILKLTEERKRHYN
jgi:hypothetical protein